MDQSMQYVALSVDDLFMRTIVLNRTRLIAGLMGIFASLAFAEKAAEVSDDFIEYLGQMEDSDDNWSDFAEQSARKDSAAHTEHSSASSITSVHGDRDSSDGKITSSRSRP